MLAEEQSNPTQTPRAVRCVRCLCVIYIYSVEYRLCIPDLGET